MHPTDIDTFASRVRGLWPGTVVTDERRNAWLLMFERYRLDDVSDAMTRWVAGHPDAWPKWTEILELLQAATRRPVDPSAWTPADEIDLAHLMAAERRIAAANNIDPPDELTVARRRIGKNPTEQERREACAILNKLIDEENGKRIHRNSILRASHYPGARYEWLDAAGNNLGPPRVLTSRQRPAKRQFAQRREATAAETRERIHGPRPAGQTIGKLIGAAT